MYEKYLLLNHNNVILFLIGILTIVKCDEITTFIPQANVKECNILPKAWFATNESYQGTTNGVVFQDDIENGCIMSENYPKPYTPTSGHKYVITVDEGYQIDIVVSEVDLDSGTGDYLSIKSGEIGEEAIFTWLHKNSKHFVTSTNIAIIDFVVQERSDPNDLVTHKGFYLEWKKTGELITTTETPTTDPTYPEDVIETLTVYITGSSTPEEFVQEKLTMFRELLVESSNQYCKEENIPIEDNITIKNINITSVSYCPIQWPNYQDCTKIVFAIPVFLKSNTDNNQTYELSEKHLKDMWNQKSVLILEKLAMEEFRPPNSSGHVMIWVGVSLIIAGLFAVFLVVLWRYEYFYTPSSIRRLSETGSVYGDKPRISDISLYPTEHQVIPPMFESLGEPLQGDESVNDFSNRNSFPLYEPEDVLFSVASKKGQNITFYTPSDRFGSYPRGYQA